MELDDTRTDYEQAVAILSGASLLIPERRHLQALFESMQEHHEVTLIQIANDLEQVKLRTLGRS
jgi:hypothetical protein